MRTCQNYYNCGPIVYPHAGTFGGRNRRKSFLDVIETRQESILFHHESTQPAAGAVSSSSSLSSEQQQRIPVSGSSRLWTVLERCPLHRPGCIAQALSQQLRLRSLDLRGQQRVSGQKIKRALLGPLLSSNPYLCKIQLPQNVESKSIEWLLEWNRIGRRAVLHVEQDVGDSTSAAVPANMWPALLERANHMCRQYDKEATQRKSN